MKRLDLQFSWVELGELMWQRIQQKQKPKNWSETHFMAWWAKRDGLGLNFDYQAVARAYKICKDLEQNGDHLVLVVGAEGAGKSVFAINFSAYICPNLKMDDICFSIEDYLRNLIAISDAYNNNLKDWKEKVILLDEAGLNLFNRESMSESNRSMAKCFMTQRYLQTAIILCIPNFWAVDAYVREHRCKTLVIIRSKGSYKIVTGKGIQIINRLGQKERSKPIWALPIPTNTFMEGSCNKPLPNTFTEKEYNMHKKAHLDEFLHKLYAEIKGGPKFIKVKKHADKMGVSRDTVKKRIIEGHLPGQKNGNEWFVTKEAFEDSIL